jgi:hypothetical protein
MIQLFPVFLARRGSSFFDLDLNIQMWVLIIGVLLFALWVLVSTAQAKKRSEYLYRKYGRTRLAEDIIARKFWQGKTTSQLRDSLGAPADTDQKVLKTINRVIWKYQPKGGNRYGLRITVEDGVVVGWDEKT